MTDELVFPKDVNADLLRKVFDNAGYGASVDADQDVLVKDKYSCYLRPDLEGKLVVLYAIFGPRVGATRAAQLDFVNRVNDQVKLIRASLMADGRYLFDYYLSVEGGVTRDCIVAAGRRFLSCLEAAVAQDTDEVVG